MTEPVNLAAIKDKLGQVDWLSGLLGPAARADFEAVCEDLAINDVADLVGEVERLRDLNARQVVLVEQARSERDASDAENERLKGCLIDLVTGRTCKAIEGSALVVAMMALAEPEDPASAPQLLSTEHDGQGCHPSHGHHYHCANCGEVSSYQGHMHGMPPAFSCAPAANVPPDPPSAPFVHEHVDYCALLCPGWGTDWTPITLEEYHRRLSPTKNPSA